MAVWGLIPITKDSPHGPYPATWLQQVVAGRPSSPQVERLGHCELCDAADVPRTPLLP